MTINLNIFVHFFNKKIFTLVVKDLPSICIIWANLGLLFHIYVYVYNGLKIFYIQEHGI